jgi:hypothetical protein
MPTLKASTILFLLTATLHFTPTPAVPRMHLALPHPPMLLVARLPLSRTTDTTLAMAHHTGDTPVQLLSSQLGTLLPIPLRLRALSRRIAHPPPRRLVTPPPPSPPWNLSKSIKCSALAPDLHSRLSSSLRDALIATLSLAFAHFMFSFNVPRYPFNVSSLCFRLLSSSVC